MKAKLDGTSILYFIALTGVILGGTSIRISNLDAASAWHDYDEGVHLSAVLLSTKGYTPYTDFFFAHPPLSLYILDLVVARGGNQEYATARMISAMLSSATLVLLAAAAYVSVGKIAAIIGTALLAMDGFSAYNSRMVMLESYVDFFLSAAVLSYVCLYKSRTRMQEASLSAVTGIALGLSVSSKMAALFGAAALLLHVLISKGKQVFGIVTITAAATYLVLCAKYLMVNAEAYLKQTFLFHIVRPPDGVPHSERWSWILTSLLDVGVVWAGIPALATVLILLPHLRKSKMIRSEASVWILWCLSYMAAFSITRTFFGHYIQHLITPLAYVTGMALEYAVRMEAPPGRNSLLTVIQTRLVPVWIVMMVLLQLGVISVTYPPLARDDTPLRVSEKLVELGVPKEPAIAFEPIYTFLAGGYPSNIVVDYYGYMMYEGMSLGRYGFLEALGKFFAGELYYSWPIYEERVQEKITRDILESRYIVIDWRARWQLTDSYLSEVYRKSSCVERIGNIDICVISKTSSP